MGQIFSNATATVSDSDDDMMVETKKEETIDLDSLNKEQLLDYILKSNFKKLDTDDKKFVNALKNIELLNNELLTIEIELYNKLKKEIQDFDYKNKNKSVKYTNKFKNFVKPKFTQENYVEKINTSTQENIPLGPLSFEYKVGPGKTVSKWVPISMEEFNTSFRDEKTKSDMLGVNKLMLSELSEFNKHKIINIYNNVFFNQKLSRNYALGRTSLIYKGTNKGSDSEVSAFRQVTCIPNAVNHLHRIMSLRLNNYLQENEYIDTTIQKGGVSNINNPIFQQILKLKNTIKHAKNSKKECCILFVDLSNAFTSIKLQRVCEVLQIYGVDPIYIKYIQNYYQGLVTYTETPEWKTKPTKWNDGLLQGCPLSPLLFITTFNYILKYLENKYLDSHGFVYSNTIKLLLLGYMDDVTIITKDYNAMMEIFNKFSTLCKEFGLEVNMSKTKYMHINKPEIVIREDTLEEKEKDKINIELVTQYKYLGHVVYNNSLQHSEFYRFYYQIKYRLESLNKLPNEKKLHLVKLLIPAIQKKFTIMYDVNTTYKKRIIKMIKYYLNTWNLTIENLEVQLVPDIKTFVDQSNDKILKNITIEDEPQIDEALVEEPIININNVVFSYDNNYNLADGAPLSDSETETDIDTDSF